MKRIVILSVFVLFLTACKTYDYIGVKTGLFNNDLKAMMEAYEKIVSKVTTKEELKSLGFDLNVPNIRHLTGPDAMKLMFGENFFQNAFMSKVKLEEFLEELNYYQMVIVPYRDLLEVSDRFYLSKKDTYKSGEDLNIYFVFKNDIVVYRAKNYTEVNETRRKEAFLQGLLELFEKFKFLDNIYKKD